MTRNPNPEQLNGRELVDRVTADSERAELGLRRGNLLVTVVGVVFVLVVAAGAVAINRLYPPPSPPNTATQEQLDDLRADLDQYLAGRGGLRDQQYAKTVYTLCELAADLGNREVTTDYDCAAVLANPTPSVSAAPSVVVPSTSATPTEAPTSGVPSTAANTESGARPPPTSSTSAAPLAATPTRTRPAPTSSSTPPATTSPAPLLTGLLCDLPILTLCPGGTS